MNRTFLAVCGAALLSVAAFGNIVAYCFLGHATPNGRTAAVIALSFSTLVACQLGLIGSDEFRGMRSSRELISAAETANGPLQPDVPFYNVKMFDHTIPLKGRRQPSSNTGTQSAFGRTLGAESAFSNRTRGI
jgi:hypothetical protein